MKKIYHSLSKVLACVSVLVYAQETTAQTAVSIDFQTQRYLDEVSELDRSKFFNIHMSAGKDYTDQDMEDLQEWDVKMGRSFWGAFGRYNDYISSNQVFPTEDKIMSDGQKNIISTKEQPFYKHITRQLVVTDHPSSMIHMDLDTEEAGKFAAKYFKYNYEDELRPLYYEPVNEPFVHAKEFMGDSYKESEVRRKTAEYFKEIGKAFDEEGLNTFVVGYSSAWPSMELWDFGHWESRMKMFMDVAGDYMDGFSTHLYDGINVTGQDTERSGSNADAILDLIETYSYIKWGMIKPHAITEYGGISEGYGNTYTDVESIQTVRSINHIIFGLMDREDRLMISIPFITGKSPWYYEANDYEPYGANLWRPVKSSVENGVIKEYSFTEKVMFYDLWKNVQGKRVRCSSSNPDVFVQAFVHEDKAYICLNNIATDNQDVALQFLSSVGDIENINKRSLKIYQNEKAIYEDMDIDKVPESVTLEPHETVVLTYDLDKAVTFNKKAVRKEYYSKTYMQPIENGEKLTFDFNDVEVNAPNGEARLRMAIGRIHNLTKKPKIKLNGTEVNVLSNWKGYDQANRDDFFGVIEVPVPHQLLKASNTVEISFPDDGGTVSSVVLFVNNIYDVKGRLPFNGQAFSLPQKVEAEDFDFGGQGIAYNTAKNENTLGFYRLNEGVNIDKNDDAFEINLQDGEWTSYSIDVPESASYTLKLNTSSNTEESKITLAVDNENLGEPITITNSDNMEKEIQVELPKGSYPLHLSANGNVKVDYLEFSNAQTLSDAITFTSSNSEIKMGETNTFEVEYTAANARDIVLELWGDAFLLGQSRVTVEAGTGNADIPMDVYAEPLNYSNVELVARVVQVNSNSLNSFAEEVYTEFDFNPVLSVENGLADEELITVFPNPLGQNQSLGIRGESKIYQVEVINMHGQVLDTFEFSQPLKQVNLSIKGHYQQGIYLVKIYGEQGSYTKKIMIQ
ncbi:T9SS type A sorting domain-containing protein [Flammeovirga sp. SubArs3]|uniref:T9SS type A sorting domain-containing protein n=1 Tax=Flammeovirga sp. SubArs3 TaxID=2995316 RepID=UPI00248BC1E6|nr:T9SS type A sorting domain-containing protein [Flammeovirga sp. SubArs3]